MKIFTVFLFVLFVSVDVAFAADFYNGDEQKNYPGQEAKSQLSDFGENAEKIKKIQENKNNIHIPFISNYGQINEGVKFYADFFSGTFFVGEKELTYLFAKQKKQINKIDKPADYKSKDIEREAVAIKEKFLDLAGNQINFNPRGESKSAQSVSFFKGNEDEWRSGVQSYDSISLGEIWKGIEVTVQAKKDNVEKIFHVQSGADVDDIQLFLEGADRLSIDERGELLIETKIGKFSITKPVAYQFIDGKKKEVQVSYSLTDNNKYGFIVGDYDKNEELIIDPLVGSTYIGSGQGSWREDFYDVDFDSEGNVYLAGYTTSATYPTTAGVIYPNQIAGDDVFVSVLSSDMSSLLASTYLGGSGSDRLDGMILDGDNIILLGRTKSTNFPTTANVYDRTHNSAGSKYQMFLTKLNKTLTQMQASTYYGTPLNVTEYGIDLAVDSAHKLFVLGYTSSASYPTTVGAYDRTIGGRDMFVSKIDNNFLATPSCIEASTFLGGTSGEYAYVIRMDNNDNVVVVGDSVSTNYPVSAGAFQSTLGTYGYSIVVSKLSNDLTTLQASTYLGGNGGINEYDELDGTNGMDLDSDGNVYIVGTAWGDGYPTTPGAYRETYNATGGADVFIGKLNSTLTNLDASTYFGGLTSDNIAYSVDVDSNNKVYVTGYSYNDTTGISDVPTTSGAFQEDPSLLNQWGYQVFVSRFNSSLNSLEASSFIDGNNDGQDAIVKIRPSTGDAVVVFSADASDLPVTANSYSTTVGIGSGYAAILDADLSRGNAPSYISIEGSATQSADESQTITLYARNAEGEVFTDYSGDKSFTFSGPSNAIDGTVSTCSDKNGNDVEIGEATVLNFVNGAATCNLKLYRAQGVSVDATDGMYGTSGSEDYDLDIVVSPGAVSANNSTIDVSNDPSVMLVEETVTITAKDSYKNILQAGGENVEISISGINSKSLEIVDNGNGTYSGVYTPTCDLGIDDITGKINGNSIGSDEDGTSDGVYNIATQMKVTITVNDASGSQVSYGGDNVVLSVSGANEAVPVIVDNGDGTYSGYYTPTNAGIDHISGTLNGRTIGSDTDGTDNGVFDIEICQAFVSYDNKAKNKNHLAISDKSNFFPRVIGDKVAQISSVIIPKAQAKDSDEIKTPKKNKQNSDSLGELEFEKEDNVSVPFIKNEGIIKDDSVKFFSNLQAGKFYVTEKDLNYSISNNQQLNDDAKRKLRPGMFFREYFSDNEGNSISFSPKGEEEAEIKSSFFRGSDEGKWKTDSESYKQLSLGEIWKDINVKLFSYKERLEKVFYISPGGDVSDIALNIKGVDKFIITENGEISVIKKDKIVNFSKPVAYQEMENGERKNVVVSYYLKDEQAYGFQVGPYDKSKELIIDPYLGGTYLGGADNEDTSYSFMDQGKKIAKDSSGNVFIIGSSVSVDFPLTAGAYDATKSARNGVVISKFNSNLTELLASTTIEGTSGSVLGDNPEAIAIDSSGDVFILTTAFSTDFPTTVGAYDNINNTSDRTMVISKFNNDLSELKASTFLQGTRHNEATDLAIDGSGNIYVLGRTGAQAEGTGFIHSNFPITSGAYLPNHYREGTPSSDNVEYIEMVAAKFNNDLSSLMASTYIPLSWSYSSLLVTRSGNVAIGGMSSSDPSTPSTGGAFDTNFVAGKAAVLLLNSDLTNLLSATYLGGASGLTAAVKGLEEDVDGNIIATGFTRDSGFPTTEGAYDRTFDADAGTSFNLFLSKFNSNLSQLSASTFYGVHYDNLYDVYIDSDSNSNIFITGPWLNGGITSTTGAFREDYNSSIGDEVFVSKFDSDLSSVTASTFIPGQYSERAMGIFVDGEDNVYTTGITTSSDLPIADYPALSYDVTHSGNFSSDDLYILKLDNYLSNNSDPESTSISAASCTPVDDSGQPNDPPVDDDTANNDSNSAESDNKDYINLKDSKKDTLIFDVNISKNKEVRSDSIKDEDDESTEVKSIKIKTKEDKKIEGDMEIKAKKEKPDDVVFPPQVDTCVPYQIIDVDTDFSDKNIKKASINFRIKKEWLRKYGLEKLIFVMGKSANVLDKLSRKDKWLILSSELVKEDDSEYIYRATSDSLDGWWGIYSCPEEEKDEAILTGVENNPDNSVEERVVTQQNNDIAAAGQIEATEELNNDDEVIIQEKKSTGSEIMEIMVFAISIMGLMTAITKTFFASPLPFISLVPKTLQAPFWLRMANSGKQSVASAFRTIPFLTLSRKDRLSFPFDRKKNEIFWGVVFDSYTKQPIADATVYLMNEDRQKSMDQKFTDKQGRFGFLISEDGTYSVRVKKGAYLVSTKNEMDNLYGDLYTGPISLKSGDVFALNIALVAPNVDWNKFAQDVWKRYNSFFFRFIKLLLLVLYIAGFALAIYNVFYYPNMINYLILFFYIILFIIKLFKDNKKFGVITNRESRTPLPFAVVELYNLLNKQRSNFAISDVLGRYYLLAENGKYTLKLKCINIQGESFGLAKEILVKKGIFKNDLVV